jgi:hypothetical protein
MVGAMVANSDLIVMGTPVDDRSVPVLSQSFLFTVYTVHVDQVLFDKTHNVSAGDKIIISRPGGNLIVDNVNVRAIYPVFDQFTLNTQYIFGVRAISNTGTYRAIPFQTFVIRNGSITSGSKVEHFSKSLPDFMFDLTTAITTRSRQ